MKVLLIGSGGREHALAWKIAQSPLLDELYAAPGNPGIADHATLVSLDVEDHAAVIAFAKERRSTSSSSDRKRRWLPVWQMICVRPVLPPSGLRKQPLSLRVPRFTKDLCARYDIPTGAYQRFKTAEPAKQYVREQGAPIVIKADGLAAGKGVTVAMSEAEALAAIDDCFDGALALPAPRLWWKLSSTVRKPVSSAFPMAKPRWRWQQPRPQARG